MFPYFASRRETHGSFRVIAAAYVSDSAGTGIVHQAPAFGEEDYDACAAAGIIRRDEPVVCPVDANGCFTSEVGEYAGRFIKDADKDIIQNVKKRGRLVKQAQIVHSVAVSHTLHTVGSNSSICGVMQTGIDCLFFFVMRVACSDLLALEHAPDSEGRSLVVRECGEDQGSAAGE